MIADPKLFYSRITWRMIPKNLIRTDWGQTEDLQRNLSTRSGFRWIALTRSPVRSTLQSSTHKPEVVVDNKEDETYQLAPAESDEQKPDALDMTFEKAIEVLIANDLPKRNRLQDAHG